MEQIINSITKFHHMPKENKMRLLILVVLLFSELYVYENLITNSGTRNWVEAICSFVRNPYCFFEIEECCILLKIFILFLIVYSLYLYAKIKKYNIGIHAHTASKLLANAISPRFINLLFLFIFVIHITWLGNSSFNIISKESDFDNILIFTIAFISTLIIISIFPTPHIYKKSMQNVYFSGISFPLTDKISPVTSWNIFPLIRGLKDLNVNDHICILLSNAWLQLKNESSDFISKLLSKHYDESFIYLSDVKEGDTSSRKVKKSVEALQRLAESLNGICEYLNKERKSGLEPLTSLEYALKEYIKALIIYEYPDKELIISTISFDFTPPCDYNDFDSCYQLADEKLNMYEKRGDSIVINSTPGTVVATAISTLLSLDSDRRLLYYKQFCSDTIEDRIKETKCNDISLNELIDRVTEKISLKY